MPNRNLEQYPSDDQSWYDEPTGDGPAVRYSKEQFPDVRAALETLNQVALLDEQTACIQYPAGDPAEHERITKLMQDQAQHAVNHGLSIVSFDIDLTLRTGDDYEEQTTLIDPQTISELQALGYVVGTCSDREPSNQREAMAALGQAPHFCIPKEMLSWTRQLIPANQHLHVGDDAKRDQDMATKNGWEHQWPDEFRPP